MLFSIGIPAYKASFLKECIQSILNQTYDDFELIIVNDNSPENLEEVICQFDDDRIRYFKNKKNIGAEHVVDNWNKCLSFAKGDYFVLMGDDDFLEPTYLEEFLLLIENYPRLDVLHCQSYIVNEASEKIGITPSWPEFESVYENIWHRMSGLRLQYISDFVYRTNKLLKEGGFHKLPLAWASDDVSSYIAIGNNGIVHLNKPLFNYRKSTQTISTSGNVKLKFKAIVLEHDWLEMFLKKEPLTSKDKIIHGFLKNMLEKYSNFKKAEIISQSFSVSFIHYLKYWILNKNSYNLSLFEIFIPLLKFIKIKIQKLFFSAS